MKLATVGDNCIDFYEDIEKFFPGGNPVNVAVYFVRSGGKASYTGVVGDDNYGEIIINSLKQKNVDISYLRVLEGNTAVTKVKINNGERILGEYKEGVLADFELNQNDIDFLKSHDLIHTGIFGNMEKYLPEFEKGESKISFDFSNKFESEIVDKVIDYLDYAFFSYEKDDRFIRNFMKKIYKRGPQYVVITLGSNGSLVYNGDEFFKYGIVEVEVVDTMGAGDSYIAGFLKGQLENKGIYKSMEMGAASASRTLKYSGAW